MNIGIDFDKFQTRESVTVMTNFTRTPNFLVDAGFMASMSGNAFKCLHCILRQTIGFNRNSHNLPENLIRKTTGIKNKDTFYASIRELEQLQLITVSREKGKVNTYSLNLEYSEKLGVVPNISTPKNQDYSTQEKQECSTPKKQESLKETLKENIKEIHILENSPENSVDEILNLWKPNLHSLNSWLQRAGEKSLTQEEMENILLEVNAHYERHIRSDAVSDSKMYANFVKWVKGDFSKNKKAGQSKFADKPKTALQATKDQWASERFAQQQTSTVIDVNQDQVLIGGERGYF